METIQHFFVSIVSIHTFAQNFIIKLEQQSEMAINKEEKYQKLLENVYKIFTTQGIKNVSMDDVSRQLGISKKTLYQYVDSKADLVGKLNQYIQQLIEDRIRSLESMDLNAIDVLLEMSKISTEKHFRINPMITFEMRKFYPQIFDEYICHKKEVLVQSVKKNLEQGIKEGLYRQDLNTDIIAHLYFKKIEEFHEVGEGETGFSFDKIFEVMFENHIRGISNEKGIAYFEKQKKKLNFNIQ